MQYINNAGSYANDQYNKVTAKVQPHVNRVRDAAKPYVSEQKMEFAIEMIKASPLALILGVVSTPIALSVSATVIAIKLLKPDLLSKESMKSLLRSITLYTSLKAAVCAFNILAFSSTLLVGGFLGFGILSIVSESLTLDKPSDKFNIKPDYMSPPVIQPVIHVVNPN